MKIYGVLFVITALLMLIAPTAAIAGKGTKAPPENDVSVSAEAKTEGKDAENADNEDGAIKVWRSGTVETVPEFEYTVGAVAAEMPPTYHTEALKAQAIVCRTYALYNKERQKNSPSEDLGGAYLTDDPSRHQGYLSRAERKEKWGDKFEEYETKTENAVKDVLNKAITYDGEYIVAAFHAICSGKTESAKNVWDVDLPYLKSVSSEGDKLAPDYSDSTAFTREQFSSLLEGKVTIGDSGSVIGDSETLDSMIVKKIEIGGKEFTGDEVREIFGLRSSAFTISENDGVFTVKTVGYGHFVGMSQYGADYMARQGASYSEIIAHYYTDVTISDV